MSNCTQQKFCLGDQTSDWGHRPPETTMEQPPNDSMYAVGDTNSMDIQQVSNGTSDAGCSISEQQWNYTITTLIAGSFA